MVNFLVKGKSAKSSSKYFNSLTYTLSILRNEGNSSDESDSESDSFEAFTEHENIKASPCVDAPMSTTKREELDGYDAILEQMRMLGLPTSFGPSKNRFDE